jgi:hypothetical protein
MKSTRWTVTSSILIAAVTVAIAVAFFAPGAGEPPAPDVPPTEEVAIPGIERLPVRWLPAGSVIELANAREPDEPFAALAAQMRQLAVASGADPTLVGDARWAVYLAGPAGPPRIVYESGRWIDSMRWEGSSIVSSFRTREDAESAALGGQASILRSGTIALETASGTSTEEFDPLHLDCHPCTPDNPIGVQSAEPGLSLERNDLSQQVLATVSAVTGPPRPPEPLVALTGVYILDAEGEGRRLDGVSGLYAASWFANGKTLLGYGGMAAAAGRDIYFIPAVDGEAIFIDSVLGFATEAKPEGKGNRAAFALPGTDDQTVRLGVYDADAGRVRIVAERPRANFRFERSPFGEALLIVWPAGSNEIQVGYPGGDTPDSFLELIDVDTGAVRRMTFQELHPPVTPEPPDCPPDASPSPGGRYVASADRRAPANLAPCGAAYRLRVTDSATGATRTVLEVAEEACIDWGWWSETLLRATVTGTCDAYHGPVPREIFLIDTETGVSRSLTGGYEADLYLEQAPGGGWLLKAAMRLQLFSAEGNLMRDFGSPPPGYAYQQYVWSPDGFSLAILLGPANWYFGP